MMRREITQFVGLLALAGLVAFFYAGSFEEAGSAPAAAARAADTPAPRPAAEEPPPAPFDLPTAGLKEVEAHVRRHETFAEILQPYDVPYVQIVEVVEASRDVFDVRALRAGRPYHVFTDPQTGAARYFVYEQSAVEYVVLDLERPARARRGRHPVDTVRKAAEGVIAGSLYETLARADADPSLAVALSEVFAWQIDFYRIRKGDRFEIVYEERYVDGVPVGLGRVLAARFTHRGDDFYGFYFEQDGRGEYFDEEGQSLRKALLKAPLKYRRISSRYTKRRFHPVQKRWKAHLGTDYAAAAGTPVHSVGDGVVVEAGYTRYNGNWVKIRHNGTYTTGYLHFSRIAAGIERGVRVEQGQVIGYVGSTGLATGPHVCYRFWKHGRQVDPYKQEIPPSEPVADAHRAAFEHVKSRLMPLVAAPGEEPALTLAEVLPGTSPLGDLLLPAQQRALQ